MFEYPERDWKENLSTWFSIQKRRLNDFVWWFKYRLIPKHRYHVLKIGKPGYSDVRERLIYANFVLLQEFIEKEKPFDVVDWEATPEHSHAAKEMKDLYNWWINVRPKRDELDPLNKVEMPKRMFVPVKWYDNGKPMLYEWVHMGTPTQEALWEKACKDSMQFEQDCIDEDNRNIKRLADIRVFLWT